ncbi:MAG: response regulator transcription factor [Anaerolineaceae bacterium]|nr:response regulator transcription factor [Anaerolineaceae bacterium]
MESSSILVVEDDTIVSRTIERCLRRADFHVTVTNSGVEGLQIIRRNRPDLVILDVVMPGMDGYTVCREMRSDSLIADIPVLFLTAKIKDEEKITGFTAGADDYLGKPFNLDELLLRVRAILRRVKATPRSAVAGNRMSPLMEDAVQTRSSLEETEPKTRKNDRTINIRGYSLDTRTYELTTPQAVKIRLTPVQYDLLYHLMSHPGEIYSPSRLLDEVWDYPTDAGSPDLVRVHIKNLRERIEVNSHNPTFIETVPGYGYTIRESLD